jgi:hypothetical protein
MDTLFYLGNFLPKILDAFLESNDLTGVINYHQRVLFFAFSPPGCCGVENGDGPFLFDFLEENVNLLIFLFSRSLQQIDIVTD